MNFAARLSNAAILLIAFLTLPHMPSAFPQTPIEVARTRVKRGSFFSDIKHLGHSVFDNAKDMYEEKKLLPIDYANAEKFCRSLGIVDRRRNMHCVQDLTQNFVIGSVLSLFRGNRNEEKPPRRESEFRKRDPGSRRHRQKSVTERTPIRVRENGNDSAAFQKRLKAFVSDVKAAKKEIKEVSKALRRSRKKDKKDE